MGWNERSDPDMRTSNFPVTYTVKGSINSLCVGSRGALMHRLQGTEAQVPTLERGPTGCKEIIFFE